MKKVLCHYTFKLIPLSLGAKQGGSLYYILMMVYGVTRLGREPTTKA